MPLESFLAISTTDNYAEYHQLQSTSSNTSVLEVYCVNNFEGNGIIGLHNNESNSNAGLTLTTNATARTLAHELGHACGLHDIYIRKKVNGQTVTLPNGLVQQNWLPADWCGNVPNGGYGALTQRQLIVRLLMFGLDYQSSVDLPMGNVHGLRWNAQPGLVNVGLTNMTRQPQHW